VASDGGGTRKGFLRAAFAIFQFPSSFVSTASVHPRRRHHSITPPPRERTIPCQITVLYDPGTATGPFSALQYVRIIHFRKDIDRMNRMNRIPKEQNDNGLVGDLSCKSCSSCQKHLFLLRVCRAVPFAPFLVAPKRSDGGCGNSTQVPFHELFKH
jgi:hypothetical protein